MGDLGRWAVIPAVPALLAALWGLPAHPLAAHQAARHRVAGGYPYASARCEFGAGGGPYCANPHEQDDSYDWGYPAAGGFRGGDPWGYEYRNCTSYVAWQLSRARVRPVLFNDLGNASQWIAGVTGERGVVVNQLPSPGAVAVWVVATGVGHVAWVDSAGPAAGPGHRATVTVSDYNYAGTGAFATHLVADPPTAYIHFSRG
jgi:surface antigen